MVALCYKYFRNAPADFRPDADIPRLQSPGCSQGILAAAPPCTRANTHKHDCDQNRYEDFFLHKTLSLRLFHRSFSLLDGPGLCAAMPHHKTSNVLLIHGFRSDGCEIDHTAWVPNMAC